MSPHAVADSSVEHKALSPNQDPSLQDRKLNSLLLARYNRDLTGDIDGYTAPDLPYNTQNGKSHYNPGIARANIVATSAAPHGTTEGSWAEKHLHQTPLQQHVTYWDRDNDGVIWPQDTFIGLRAWGWSLFLSLLCTLIIHITLSYATAPSYLPDPFFRLFVSRIHRAKHGSDTMAYDNQGRFRPQMFEEFVKDYDKGGKGGLDKSDFFDAWRGLRNAWDLFGWVGFPFEWAMTYALVWPEDGVLRVEDMRRTYDGSIFQKKADEWAEKTKKRGASSK